VEVNSIHNIDYYRKLTVKEYKTYNLDFNSLDKTAFNSNALSISPKS
jgi:hypothetical protein